jgi:hypothetical protein
MATTNPDKSKKITKLKVNRNKACIKLEAENTIIVSQTTPAVFQSLN